LELPPDFQRDEKTARSSVHLMRFPEGFTKVGLSSFSVQLTVKGNTF